MSPKQCCSLCCTACTEYRLMENEMGECNEVYEITVKYFDPILLTETEHTKISQEKKVLCHECWYPIKEFHEFQQTVIKSRNILEETTEFYQLPVEIKQENLACDVTFCEDERDFDKSDEEFCMGDEAIKTETIGNDSLRVETMSVSDDDKTTLSTLKRSLENKKIQKCDEGNDESQQETSRTRRGRKTKNKIKYNLKSVTVDKIDVEQQIAKRKKDKPEERKDKISKYVEKAMESDQLITEWKSELECDLCGEIANNYEKLRLHFKEKHNARFYIKCCDRKFYRRHVLVDHIQLHINPESHKCDICGKISSSKSNLKLHKRNMHENTEQYECEVCHKLFNLKTTLEHHMLTHVTGSKDFVCQECGKAYVLEIQLKSHIRTVHNVDRVCDQCGKTIHGITALKKHLMEHAGIAKQKFPCKECGAELNSNNTLRRHMEAFHHDGTTIYVCGICGKVAASKNALLTHKKNVHEEERKHKCTYCDKAFKRPKVLREHIATHTGQDLYQCPHCPQTFKVSANMHHHRKKVHPIEWEEGRKNRLQLPKVDITQVKNQVVV